VEKAYRSRSPGTVTFGFSEDLRYSAGSREDRFYKPRWIGSACRREAVRSPLECRVVVIHNSTTAPNAGPRTRLSPAPQGALGRAH
jgi:hypothetical protein